MKRNLLTLIVLAAITLFLGACSDNVNTPIIKGNGIIESLEFRTENFTAVDLSGFFTVAYRNSPDTLVVVEMQENLFEYHNVVFKNGVLSVEITGGVGFEYGEEGIPKMYIYAPFLDSVTFDGSVSGEDWDTISTQDFMIDISGFGDLTIPVDVENLNANIAGSANLTLLGNAGNVNIYAQGFGTTHALELHTSHSTVQVGGSHNAYIYASDSLDVNISDFANVRYSGSPSVIQNIKGTGSVERLD